MHPPTHALIGWAVANAVPDLSRRSRAIVFFASLIPDLDGLTIVHPPTYEAWHRVLCHNLTFAFGFSALAFAVAAPGARRGLVAFLVFVNFHLHLLCDLLGSAGPPDDSGAPSNWGIPYLQPISDHVIRNPWQWQLRSWQNLLITLAALAWTIQIARRHGRSPVEPFSTRADAAVVEVVKRRFGAA